MNRWFQKTGRGSRLCLWVLLFAGFASATTLAKDSQLFSDDSGSLEMVFPNGYQAQYAFHPIRLIAENKSGKPVVWVVSIREEYLYDDPLNPTGLTRQITVPARQRIEAEWLLPIGRKNLNETYSSLELNVVTPAKRKASWSVGSDYQSSSNSAELSAILSREAENRLRGGVGSLEGRHGSLDPALASTDWRGYTAFAQAILTPDDWKLMSPAARQALLDWARMGGELRFVEGTPPGLPAVDVAGDRAFGLGRIVIPTEPEGPTSVNQSPRGNLSFAGALRAGDSPAPFMEWRRAGDEWLGTWLKGRRDDLLDARFAVWPMILVLVGFFIMITPVNLWVLAPSRKRHLLFRTIPILSLSFCVILAAAVIFGDGIGGKGERWVWIECAGGENRVAVTQWQASRCMAVGSTSFTVDEPAYLSPIQEPGSQVELAAGGDRLEGGGGWFASRTSQSHLLQAMRPSRGRIEWTGSDSAPTAVSTFEFPLRDVLVPIDEDTWWYAREMKQGELTRFEKASKERALVVMEESLQGRPMEKLTRSLADRAGHFIAFTDQPPAIDTLRAVRWHDSGVVTGALTRSQ